MPKIENITDLEQELFDTVYTWGKYGVSVGADSETFKRILESVKNDAIYVERNKVYNDAKKAVACAEGFRKQLT